MNVTFLADIPGRVSRESLNADRVTAGGVAIPSGAVKFIRKRLPKTLPKWRDATDSDMELGGRGLVAQPLHCDPLWLRIAPIAQQMPPLTESVPSRLMEILDDRVFGFAQAAQRHFKTNDLVVVLDLRDESPELEALPRQRLADAEELSLDIRLKLSRPASALKEVLGSPDQSFWFLVIYEDDESDCGAVNASMLAPGGSA